MGISMEKEEFTLDLMEQETDEMLRIRYLNKENASFYRNGTGFLSLQVGEEKYDRVSVVRMFPMQTKTDLLSIRTTDEKSKEIGIVEKLSDVDEETGKMLLEQLELRYFMPVIKKVIQIKSEFGYAYWDVDTDKGECRFTIQMGGNAVIHLSDVRIIITDIDGNRFEIPDIEKLTHKERKKLDLFL